MHESTAIRVARCGAVHEIVLDRPKANAIDAATSRAMGAAGRRCFPAGWGLTAAAAGAEQDYGTGGFAGLTELFDLTKPVIAPVNGPAAGGGFELVLACGLVGAASHAGFFLPEALIGIVP